jgi:hypothetical protein
MKQLYVDKNFHGKSLQLIAALNAIVEEYQAQGYVLTVRQLYYQCVARDMLANTERNYKMLSELVNNARLAGLLDWDAIEDRTREFVKRPSWDGPREIVEGAAEQFHMDMWEHQDHRVYLIVEKEALAGVFGRICRKYDVPLLAARGYPSVSVLRDFAERFIKPHVEEGQTQVILHFGDHDPSGIDMTRDLIERIALLSAGEKIGIGMFTLDRLALNIAQVRAQKPPPNPAKMTDSRFNSYRRLFGTKSWELDALNPAYLSKLAEDNIQAYINLPSWKQRTKQIEAHRETLNELAEQLP